jgi:hypothetical protein
LTANKNRKNLTESGKKQISWADVVAGRTMRKINKRGKDLILTNQSR